MFNDSNKMRFRKVKLADVEYDLEPTATVTSIRGLQEYGVQGHENVLMVLLSICFAYSANGWMFCQEQLHRLSYLHTLAI